MGRANNRSNPASGFDALFGATRGAAPTQETKVVPVPADSRRLEVNEMKLESGEQTASLLAGETDFLIQSAVARKERERAKERQHEAKRGEKKKPDPNAEAPVFGVTK